MAVSRAEQSYQAFESLRNRFGGIEKADVKANPVKQQTARREPGSKRRRPDPRSNAPPLVSLVEEGEQLQEVSLVVYEFLVGGAGSARE